MVMWIITDVTIFILFLTKVAALVYMCTFVTCPHLLNLFGTLKCLYSVASCVVSVLPNHEGNAIVLMIVHTVWQCFPNILSWWPSGQKHNARNEVVHCHYALSTGQVPCTTQHHKGHREPPGSTVCGAYSWKLTPQESNKKVNITLLCICQAFFGLRDIECLHCDDCAVIFG